VDGNGHRNGNGNGNAGRSASALSSPFDDGTLELLDDDVHVIIRRADEVASEPESVGSVHSSARG